jgi:hypothetical protein
MQLRALNAAGESEFRAYLARIRAGAQEGVPTHLLQDAEMSSLVSTDVQVDHRTFVNKLELARYLTDALKPVPLKQQADERGIWSWLSLFYFEQLAPVANTGTRKLLADDLYIPSTHFQRKYRHLVWGPCLAYQLHAENSRLMLTKSLNIWSDVEEQLFGVQEFIQVPKALAAANLLYFDEAAGEPKRGITNRKKGGTIRRLREVLQQLDMTFDIFAMEADEIVALLPSEFERFKPAGA